MVLRDTISTVASALIVVILCCVCFLVGFMVVNERDDYRVAYILDYLIERCDVVMLYSGSEVIEVLYYPSIPRDDEAVLSAMVDEYNSSACAEKKLKVVRKVVY